ncbi:MAG: DUF2851 family protein [Moheibacter sp.]
MEEKFLHFIWKFQLLQNYPLTTIDGKIVEVLNQGDWNQNESGPDFSCAKIKIGNKIWVGNVELHIYSSDWNRHQHSRDKAYSSIILHVVLNHDSEIEMLNEQQIPTLELKKFISPEIIESYKTLLKIETSFIPCEKNIRLIQKEKLNLWLERIVLGRIERKSKEVESAFLYTGKNWEALLFRRLAYAFGLKINAEAFEVWANSFEYSVLQKVQKKPELVYALFFGQAGFLEFSSSDDYIIKLQKDYAFLKNKYKLTPLNSAVFKFFRLYPASFPTVRMMQLATLYTVYPNLFMFLMGSKSADKIYPVFKELHYPKFWENHYTFEKESSKKAQKQITDDLINRIIINVIIPMKYIYGKMLGIDIITELLELLYFLPPEKNTVLEKFKKIGIKPENALESQALLEMKKHFCDEKKCLNCAIGLQVLKNV